MAKNTKRRIGNLKGKKAVSSALIIAIAVVALVLVAAFVTVLVFALGDPGTADPSDTGGPAVIENSDKAETPNKNHDEPEPEVKEPEFAHADNIKIVKLENAEAPEFVNPLTGEATTEEVVNQRPVAIMINNIRVACPQEEVSKADILYECVAEGGITRLLMVTKDYAALGETGSVRSSRKYYIDFALNHDALYVHAGGSDEAYANIRNRDIEHLDGVNPDANTGKDVSEGGAVRSFYRNTDRWYSMGKEHSMMTTGQHIIDGLNYMGYRTELKDGFKDPVNIIQSGFKVELDGQPADAVRMSYVQYQTTEYIYDYNSETYLRYQYGAEHIDGTNGEQLKFANLLVLVMDHANSGDSYGHIYVGTTGSGRGYYCTGGKMIEINWTRANENDPMVITDGDGNVLYMNKGKTMINVISPAVESGMIIE
ncbi:MAG: DUF3048 domain-containing protein [Clostridia bacterium]|nr:DUF3048 domain-containing protein [Clostridia bacterium]